MKRFSRTLFACLVFNLVALFFSSPEQRPVLLPLLASADIAILFFFALWDRSDHLPLELGTLAVASVALYATVPLLSYLLTGLTLTELSDYRLAQYNPTPAEIGAFGWYNVLYLLALAVAYLWARRRVPTRPLNIRQIPAATAHGLLLMLIALYGYFALLWLTLGASYFAGSYENAALQRERIAQVPLVIHQFSLHMMGMTYTLKLGLMMVLMQRFSHKSARVTLYAWLSVELLLAFLRMGARTEALLLLVAAALLYHWMVRPLKLTLLAPAAVAVLTAFLAFGAIRDMREWIEAGDVNRLSANNEFQALFATAYDLNQLREAGQEIPWQIYVSDLYSPFPQQLLPFEKIDPSVWYLDILGIRETGVGFMFGVLSQAMLGWGWAELLLRGAILGWLFAKCHRWFVRRNATFWSGLFYLWLCVWCYWTYRSTTFALVTLFIYRFVPVVVIIRFFTRSLKRPREELRRAPGALSRTGSPIDASSGR